MKIKTYVINLKEAADRRAYVLAETAKCPCLDVELVEAVNGSLLSEDEVEKSFDCRKFEYRNHFQALPGEIGCTLSHHLCFRKLLDSDEKYALIVEDDVVFWSTEMLENVLKACSNELSKKKAQVITLAEHRVGTVKGKPLGNGYYLHGVWLAFGTNAYLINRDAAKRMLSVSRPFVVADDYYYIKTKGVCVSGILPALSTGLTTINQMETQIQSKKYIASSEKSVWFEIVNYLSGVCRGMLIRLGILCIRKSAWNDKG